MQANVFSAGSLKRCGRTLNLMLSKLAEVAEAKCFSNVSGLWKIYNLDFFETIIIN